MQASCLCIWEILLFSLQKWLWATLLRVFCKILLISPQKKIWYVSCQMYFYFVLCLCSIKSLHKIKILCLLHVCLVNCLFYGIFISKCQILCYMQCLAVWFNNKCVLFQRTLILSEWCFFESNILLFCSQPCIIACIMYFVGVQI